MTPIRCPTCHDMFTPQKQNTVPTHYLDTLPSGFAPKCPGSGKFGQLAEPPQ